MQAGKPSATALAAAAMRAAHCHSDTPVVFDDRYALDLTSEDYRQLHARGELQAMFTAFGVRPVQGQLVGRAKYAEDQLEKAVANGVSQYVIVGAGLDSFILRRNDLMAKLTVYEIDHPDTQQYKLERLRAIDYAFPANAVFLPADFERQSIADVLDANKNHHFATDRRAFFAWLGVVAYLTEDAIFSSLQAIQSAAANGSELVFDFPIREDLIDPQELALTATVKQGTADMGESRPVQHDPDELLDRICALGFEVIENLSPKGHRERYFAGRSDDLRPYPEVHIVHVRVVK